MASAAASLRRPLLQPNHHGSAKGGEPLQDREADLVRQGFQVHTLAALGTDNGDVLLTSPVGGMLEQVSSELRLFRLELFDLRPDVSQAICRMRFCIYHPPSRHPYLKRTSR